MFLLFCGVSFGQKAIFTNYSAKDGLVANPVLQIFQDSDGFMWFGTSYGLSRYDGNGFTNFTRQNGLESTFSLMCIDSQKRMQVFFRNGEKMKFENGTFRKIAKEKSISATSIYHNEDGTSVITTNEQGVFKHKNGKFIPLTGPIRGLAASYLPLENGSFLVGGQFFKDGINTTSLLLYDAKGKLLAQAETGKPFNVFRLFEDRLGRIWIGAESGLKMLSKTDAESGKIRLLELLPPFDSPLLQSTASNIIEDRMGDIWVGTQKGLFKINPSGSISHFTEQNGLVSDYILDLHEDREGNIWVGTLKGISKIPLNAHILYFGKADGLADNEIQSVWAKNRDEVYFTTVNGKFQKFDYATRKAETIAEFSKGNIYLRLFRTSQNTFYLAVGKERWTAYDLYRFSPENGRLKKIVSVPQTFFQVEEDKNENLFFASNKGLLLYNSHTEKPEIFAGVTERVNRILLDSDENLWLSCYEKKFCKVETEYTSGKIQGRKTDMSRYINYSYPGGVLQDSKGNLWAGTGKNGIFRLKFNGTRMDTIHLSSGSGLISDAVDAETEDKSGNILLISQLGMDKIIVKDDTCKIYNLSTESGFFDEIWDVSYLSENDLYWIATSSGLVRFEDKFSEKSPVPDAFILKAERESNQKISDRKLPYNFGGIHFYFASPSFINEKSTRFSYRLTGSSEQGWSIPSHQNSVRFAELKPGDYTFEVRSVNWNGTPGKSDTYSFSVAPPWWDTWWFRLLTLLVVSGLVYFFVKIRIRNIKDKADLKRKILETELMALRAQMNPHFIFNCLNNIDAFVQSNDKYNATMYLNKFARLLRNVLESSKQNLVPLSKDLETLKLYTDLEQLRDRDKYKVVYSIDSEMERSGYEVPPLIVQPYVENAIIHGLRKKENNDGILKIEVKKVADGILYVIEDNGIGRKATLKHKSKNKNSYGMQISSDRVKYFNNEEKASVSIFDLEENGKTAGTRVEVLLNLE